jgi:RHS repeat-associated protein
MVATAPSAPSSPAGPSAQGHSASWIASDRRGATEVLPENDVFDPCARRRPVLAIARSCIGRTRPHCSDTHPDRRRFSRQTRIGRYCRARYYHPQLQRFISEDPIGFAGRDVNLYSYVRNNPLRFIDPLGLDYLDVNVSGGTPWFVGGTGGAMVQDGCIYPYVGGGLVTPGVSPAVTWSPSSVTTGWTLGLQVNFGPAFQVGYSFGQDGGLFWEVGGSMPPGASLTAYYVFDRAYCKPKAPPAASSKSSK